MTTPALLNSVALLQSATPTAKLVEAPTQDVPFNQILSREMADRENTGNTASAKPSTAQAAPSPPPSTPTTPTPKSASGKTAVPQQKGHGSADAAAALQALVVNLESTGSVSPNSNGAVAAKGSAGKIGAADAGANDPGANASLPIGKHGNKTPAAGTGTGELISGGSQGSASMPPPTVPGQASQTQGDAQAAALTADLTGAKLTAQPESPSGNQNVQAALATSGKAALATRFQVTDGTDSSRESTASNAPPSQPSAPVPKGPTGGLANPQSASLANPQSAGLANPHSAGLANPHSAGLANSQSAGLANLQTGLKIQDLEPPAKAAATLGAASAEVPAQSSGAPTAVSRSAADLAGSGNSSDGQKPLPAASSLLQTQEALAKAAITAPDPGPLKAEDVPTPDPTTAAPAPMQAQQASVLAAQTAPANTHINLGPAVGSAGWGQALGQKVVWMASGGVQSASLSLNPPDLGPLQVVLSVSNSQASASFTANQPEVRLAIEASLPKLREMLADTGIQLGQTTVSAGMPNQYSAPGEQQFQQAARFATQTVGNVSPPQIFAAHSTAAPSSGQGLIDTFA